MVVAPKTEHGMRARFHCKDGFSLRGPELLLCSFGNWTGEMPICQEGNSSSLFTVFYAGSTYWDILCWVHILNPLLWRIVTPYHITVYHVSSGVSSCGCLIFHSVYFMIVYQISNDTVSALGRRCRLFCSRCPTTHFLLYKHRWVSKLFLNNFCICDTAISIKQIAHVLCLLCTTQDGKSRIREVYHHLSTLANMIHIGDTDTMIKSVLNVYWYFTKWLISGLSNPLLYVFSVYCPFPGYIDHGKVLLVGNMGLYDYRPYVKKVNITIN